MLKKLVPMGVLCTMLAACATDFAKSGGADDKNAVLTSAAMGSAIGCAAGALVARLTDSKAAAGCAIGAVGGGLIAWQRARDEELKAMKEAAATLPGSRVEVAKVDARDKTTGETKKVDVFQSLAVPLPASSLTDSDGQRVYANLAELAKRQQASVIITGGTARQRDAAATLIQAKGTPATIDPAFHTSAGHPGDLVVVLRPKSAASRVEI